jgi:hypothetical protein
MTGYYIKRGEKVFGPHSTERLEELRNTAKVKPTDLVSESASGPFESFVEFEQRIFATAPTPSKAFDNIDFPTNTTFADALPPPTPQVPPAYATSYSSQPTPVQGNAWTDEDYFQNTKKRMKQVGFKWLLFPWLLEEESTYFNLRRWLSFSKRLTKIGFVLCGIVGMLWGVGILFVGLAGVSRSGHGPIGEAIPIMILLWILGMLLFLALLHLW